MILELCEEVHCVHLGCVHLGESFQTHIYLQNLASIRPGTSPLKGSKLRGSRGSIASRFESPPVRTSARFEPGTLPLKNVKIESCGRFGVNIQTQTLHAVFQKCKFSLEHIWFSLKTEMYNSKKDMFVIQSSSLTSRNTYGMCRFRPQLSN